METPLLEIEGTWEELSVRASEFEGRRLRFLVLPLIETEAKSEPLPNRAPKARELLKMSDEERNQILAAQVAKAALLYTSDPELTDFEAYAESDIFDETL